jgi:asparaginyl-tRNA synthetase
MLKGMKVKEVLALREPGQEITVNGWVRSVRDSKEILFAMLNDGSCMDSLQVVVDAANPGFKAVKQAGAGAALSVHGALVQSQGKGQALELKADAITVLGACPEDYPLQKKRHSFEFLRTIAHLRPRTNTFGAIFRIRNTAAWAIHKFFQERGFLYVHTPIISSSDAEGAGQIFQVTTLDLANPPRTPEGAIDYAQDFFGQKTGLTVSGQLEGETFAMAFGEIYTFGPTFRAENSNTARHASEFWMIEPEACFYDLDDDVKLAEDFLRFITATVLDNCGDDLKFLDERIEPGLLARLEAVRQATFNRVTYTQAIEILEGSGKAFDYKPSWGIDLQTEHERYLAEEHFKGPVFVTDYPKEIKAFYMKLNSDGKTVRAMDLLVPKVGEIIGGSQREDNLEVLEARMKELHLKPEDYSWYLDLRRYGSAPHAGFGLGFERTIMYLTGMPNIRDVVPYPRTPGSAEF